jgi:Ca2+-binding RTX toxin-like protein
MPILPPPPVGPFDQTLLGDDLNNVISGGAGADYIRGLGGNDTINAGGGNDYVEGGDGNDLIQGAGGNDTILGGAGDDTIAASAGNNQLFGGEGNDVLFSGTRASILVGGEGNDTLQARIDQTNSNHTLEGGSGADLFAILNASAAHVAELQITDFNTAQDAFSIDGVMDDVIMNQGVYLVHTGTGIRFTHRTGDILHFDGLNPEDIAQAYGLNGDDTIIGNGQDEYIYGGEGNNNLDGANGNDLITAGRGNDTMYGGNGNDTIAGKNGADWLFGGNGDDVIYGNSGQNRIFGEAGNDRLYSGQQSSRMYGGEGDDYLEARVDKAGQQMTGDEGADLFNFIFTTGTRATHSTITDFTIGEDAVQIESQNLFTLAGMSGGSFAQTAAGARYTLTNGSTVTFAGVDAADLNALIDIPWPILH